MPFITSWIYSQPSKETSIEGSPKDALAFQLQDAISKNDPQIIKKSFVSLSRELINTSLPNGELPLHFAIRHQSSQIVELLFAHPQIDLNKRDDQGLTALDHLFLTNNQEFKGFILGLFCKKTVENVKSCSNDEINIIKEEIHQRAYNRSSLDALHLAAKSGNLTELNNIFLSGAADLNKQTSAGHTALHYAVKSGNESTVQWLIKHGARTDLLTNHRVSVLHVAALSNNRNIINLLIEKGVNPNTHDDAGYTPLHYATLSEDFTTARFLIEKGANPLVETARISPMVLMVNIAQNRSRERDPLKLGLLQTLMCICSIATWAQSYYGNNTDLLASVLQYASSSLLSLITIDHLIKLYNNSKDLKALFTSGIGLAFPLALPLLDKTPILGEVSLIFRTYFATQSIWQGIQAGWRNRKLDPSRSLKNVLVHSTNAAFSVWNIHRRVKNIWNNYSLKLEVESQLANKNCSEAFKTASKMHWYPLRDETLVNIVDQCAKDDLNVAEKAISLMCSASSQDLALSKIVELQLNQKNCEGALEAASKMNIVTYQDTALQKLVGNHLKQGNCEGALDAASKMNIVTYQDKALGEIVTDSGCLEKQPAITLKAASLMNIVTYQDTALQKLVGNHLKQGNCEGALDAASKMNIATYQDKALGEIVTDSGCLEKQPAVTLKAASLMNIATYQDIALQKLAAHHLKQGNCEGALDTATRMNIASYQDKPLTSIATDPTCLEKHKDVANKAASLLESNAWWRKIAYIAYGTLFSATVIPSVLRKKIFIVRQTSN